MAIIFKIENNDTTLDVRVYNKNYMTFLAYYNKDGANPIRIAADKEEVKKLIRYLNYMLRELQ
jgi:hypothetical protein